MLKSELSHLMREASCPNFIGGMKWSTIDKIEDLNSDKSIN